MTDLGPDFLFRPKGNCELCETVADTVSIPNNYDRGRDIDLCSSCLQLAHSFLLRAVAEKLPDPPEPKEWEIWVSGYVATGERASAQLLGKAKGHTFDEAVQAFRDSQGEKHATYYRKHPDGRWSMWACWLYDNENDARKSYG